MQALVIDNGTALLVQLITALHRCGCTTKVLKIVDVDADNLPAADFIVLSGSHRSSVQKHFDTVYAHEVEVIRTTKLPILGICLGYELIVKTFGGKLMKLQQKAVGKHIIDVTESDGLFDHNGSIEVYASHRWAVSDAGEYLITLASSDNGVEAVKLKHKHIYGVQFHPELSGETGAQILRNFLTQISG